ncbi:shikimate dehydrogenase [Chelativorans sp. M5D2P16]|uniref:shikimate dehydrogenase family protein n=1 Tax=Chelativorans sp. M5D2P16 TaxID=3095678 RepID=UPI002ACAA6E6|nr:shikimate dehydrogenase [Chelativorans sp. M5D2P16]MDZ5699752.1 shikimate dehydrogenase [Chelativorans sp. M5D2P16]
MSPTEITGRTRIYGILADPIHHVKTPQVMNALLRRHGVEGVLVPFHVAPGGLQDLLGGLRRTGNFGGFIATVPHKTAMLRLCDRVSSAAEMIGAVNCVRREADGSLSGTMLDGIGFIEGLRAAGVEPRGLSAYLAGAGGAGRAIAFALAEAGVTRLTIANRTLKRARELAEAVAAAFPAVAVSAGTEGLSDHDLIVNATSLGLDPADPPPVDVTQLRPGQVVAEAIMEPEVTPLLEAAKACGCRVQPGRPMLDSQIALMARHMGALS